MSNEQLRRIAIGLGLLVIIWLGIRTVRRLTTDTELELKHPEFSIATADTIVIARPADTLRMVKRPDRWTVNGFVASKAAIDDLLRALTDTAAISELVAESPTSHASMGVDSANARRLTVKAAGAVLVSYLVGKRGANWESVYLRRPGQARVFQVRGRLVEFVERRLDDWRERRIVHVEPDSITRIEISRGTSTYVLTRKDAARWTLGAGIATDSAAAARLAGEFRNLESDGFATAAQADSADLGTPDRRIRLVLGGTATTLLFDSTATGYWVRRDSLPTVFRLGGAAVNRITPPDSTLRTKPPAPAPPPAAVPPPPPPPG